MNVTSPAVQKKVCILGGFSVGKTSLIRRYVESIFSETYITTVGVKIDKKTLDLGGRLVSLILWDVAGEDDMASFRMTYLRGAAGYLLVADGTRPSTLDVALSLRERVGRRRSACLRRRSSRDCCRSPRRPFSCPRSSSPTVAPPICIFISSRISSG